MMDNHEKNIVDKIKIVSESLPVPQTLETENIIKKLKEYEPEVKRKRYGKGFNRLALISACFLLIIIFAGSYYLGVQQKNESNEGLSVGDAKEGVATASSYQEIYKILSNVRANETKEFAADGAMTEGKFGSSEESLSAGSTDQNSEFSSTNIQVEGVDEGDVVKTDGRYLYILEPDNNRIRIMDTSNGQLKETSQISIDYVEGGYQTSNEIYIKGDSLVLIYNSGNSNSGLAWDSSSYAGVTGNTVVVETYDISDRSRPELKGSVNQEGGYSSSRMVGDYVYLISDCSKYYTMLKEDNCTPYVNGEPVEPQQVYLTDDIDSPSYNVITSVNINSPSAYSCIKTVLGNYSQIYVSNNNIYIATNVFAENDGKGQNETEIMKLAYQEGNIEGVATARVKGTLKNSFSLDEYNGNLRLVTTVTTYNTTYQEGSVNDSAITAAGQTSNNLYILGEGLAVLGKIENLAPEEQLYSARFMGNTGYFVTFKNIDPLFSVDLTDPANPRILGELKIPGFSEYLHFWSDNLLLGIGKEVDPETNRTIGLKLSMFNISNPSDVTEVHKTVLEGYQYSYVDSNHKAVLVDNDKNLIGFAGGKDYAGGFLVDYLVYQYDVQEGFILRLQNSIQRNQMDYARGLYIKDTFYLVQPGEKISMFNLDNFLLSGEFALK